MPLWTLNIDGEPEKLLEAIAKARHERDPDAFEELGHMPDVVIEAFALGLELLARKEGIDPEPFVLRAGRARRSDP